MSQGAGAENGALDPPKPALPLPIAAAAFVVVVGIVAVLIVLLFRETTGPGEVLHEYYEAVAAGRCDSAYELLSSSAQQETSKDTFCQFISDEGRLAGDFTLKTILLRGERGDVAEVTVEEDGGVESTWNLEESGDTWRIREIVPEQPLAQGATATP